MEIDRDREREGERIKEQPRALANGQLGEQKENGKSSAKTFRTILTHCKALLKP